MPQTVVYFSDSTEFGGAEQVLLHLMAGLDRRRWQPVLFHHPAPGLAPLLQQAAALGVTLCPMPPMPLGWQGARQIPSFVKALRAWRPAVFHAQLTWPLSCKYGLVGALLARIPATMATSHLFFDLPYSLATRIQQRLLAAKLGGFIAVSHGLAQRWQQVFAIPASQMQVIHNGIPVDCFAQLPNPALRRAWQGARERTIALTVARLDPQKGQQFLLEAARQLPDICLVWVGDGPDRSQLAAQAQAAGLADRVHFLGQRSDIPTLLASCDLFVLPSLFEGLPLSLLEAMAAGKPVITSAIPGTMEAVTHEVTGLLTAPADPAALVAAIRRLLDNPAQAQRLAAAAQAHVQQNFTVERMVQRVMQVYDNLLVSQRWAP